MRILAIALTFTALLLTAACSPEQTTGYVPVESCEDGILNQGEIEIDCGGPCPLCNSRMKAKVDGSSWNSVGEVTSSINNNSIIILAGGNLGNLSMIYNGPFDTGTYVLQSALYNEFSSQTDFFGSGGTITFTEWNNEDNFISGKFSFTGIDFNDTTSTRQISSGEFKFVVIAP